MEALIILLITCLIIYWAIPKGKTSNKTSAPIKASVMTPTITVSVQTSTSSGFSDPDTGSISPASDGGWILNPKSTFPLTLYEITQSKAEEIKSVMDKSYSQGSANPIRSLISIVARTNVRCKQIDDYIRKFKPIYLAEIARLKHSSAEWVSASEKDHEDLLTGFRKQAIQSLDVRPSCDVEILLEGEPVDATLDDALIDRFGFDNLQVYLRYAGKLNKVHVIRADHYDREAFEKLVELGLAIRGAEIPVPALLETLTLKEMTELISDLRPPAFKRKAMAIEFLLGVHDINKRLGKTVAFRELFQLKVLPAEFSQVDLRQISSEWRYVGVIAELLCETYVHVGYEARRQQQHRQYLKDDQSFIIGWEVSTGYKEGCCSYCNRAAALTYSKEQQPRVPHHVGCRCSVSPKYKGM